MSKGIERFNEVDQHYLPGLMGMQAELIEYGHTRIRMPIQQSVMAPNGFLHAGSVVSLADTAAGVGCLNSLPDGASSFTTIELKSNFLGTCTEGAVVATAKLLHGGRTTQVWDAVVGCETSNKAIAHFRCTQMILYPR